jgi:molecular chaperone Hsp33
LPCLKYCYHSGTSRSVGLFNRLKIEVVKMMEDYLIRAIATEARVRAVACVTTEMVREGVERHSHTPVAKVALGQALTGAALMGSLLKAKQRIAIKWQGDYP